MPRATTKNLYRDTLKNTADNSKLNLKNIQLAHRKAEKTNRDDKHREQIEHKIIKLKA